MCKIISISNQKGGVGKTTTAISLGQSLVLKNKKVLLIDLDPQANLTMALGYKHPDEIKVTIATLMKAKATSGFYDEQDYIKTVNDVDLLPSNIELAELDFVLMQALSREQILKRILESLKEKYDYIIIDCPPALSLLSINAWTASDEVIIPVQPQYLSVKGLELLCQSIIKIKNNLNSTLVISGILITMIDNRTTFQKQLVQDIERIYGSAIRIFKSKIPLSVKVSETQAGGNSLLELKNNKVAEAYMAFSDEIVNS